jgi:hypothetical protein
MLPFFLFSCDKSLLEVTESEVAEIIETALQQNSGGPISSIVNTAAQIESNASSGGLCDTLYLNTISRNYAGIRIEANYSSDFSYEMTCNNWSIPQDATFLIGTTSTYFTRRVAANGQSDFSGNISGLQLLSSSLNLNGTYKRSGDTEINIEKQKNISTTFSL